MSDRSHPADDDQARIRWIIIDALRLYGTDSGRIGHAFAELHRLQAADLRALVAIMSAEGNGTPLTAGQLREQLGLSSGGASLLIDRLEQAGHIRHARDHPADNRVVHLRYTDQGKATGLAFFGSLGDRARHPRRLHPRRAPGHRPVHHCYGRLGAPACAGAGRAVIKVRSPACGSYRYRPTVRPTPSWRL